MWHGDRTPALEELYPKDPYQAETYFPEGLGELTKAGKKREYLIGKELRKKYGSFLGKYKSSRIFARSTDYVRTKMSCLLLLAGLYPPGKDEMWDDEFNWQPIPYSHEDYYSDDVTDPVNMCPRFIKSYNEYLSKEGDGIYKKNKEIYDYVSNNTGLEIKNPRQIYFLHFVLQSEISMGLELPEWTKPVWPENMTKAAVDEYYLAFSTPQMKRLSGGKLLKKIIDDTKAKIAPNSTDERRIYIYSAHENNIAYQLMFVDAFYPHVPPYGSYLVVEIHKINDVYGVKMLYEDYTKHSGYISILNCGEFCPLDKFIDLMKDNLPTSEDIFRHGMRYPKHAELYPNDPYSSYFPEKLYSHLTENGKIGSYALGQFLRERYDELIGSEYKENIVQTTSTSTNRTVMTAQLVLAGMFQRSFDKVLSKTIDWDQLPFQIKRKDLDINLYGGTNSCIAYDNEYRRVLNSSYYVNIINNYATFFQYLSSNTGVEIKNLRNVNNLYQTLKTEECMGLLLPEWTRKVYPTKIHDAAASFLTVANSNSILRRLNGGRLLRIVIDNVFRYINDKSKDEPNIHLLSGHDRTVASVLAALELFEAHVPKYNSAVLFELHQDKNSKNISLKYSILKESVSNYKNCL
ncbi:hypothetical protein FQR65_LT08517 [Abscondita terminalis]|nr:hypothetical protein FQR65_LT08517 [Abscondita terminalis]